MTLLRNSPELLASFRRGDRETLATVYRAYSSSIERYLTLLTRRSPHLPCSAATADLRQDTFERAFSVRARHAYDATKEFRPYLMTIARNCFVNAVRHSQRELLNLELDAVENIEDPSHLASFRDPRLARLLAAYIGGLPDPLRSTFEQRFVFGNSQSIASSELGVTRRHLRTREEYLRRSLRRTLQAEGVLLRDCW